MTLGRKLVLGVAAAAVAAMMLAPTEASARWHGRHWGGGWGWGGAAVGLGLGLGLAAGYPYYGPGPYYGGYYGYSPYYGGGCWRRIVVHTPWGPRVRRAWVC